MMSNWRRQIAVELPVQKKEHVPKEHIPKYWMYFATNNVFINVPDFEWLWFLIMHNPSD